MPVVASLAMAQGWPPHSGSAAEEETKQVGDMRTVNIPYTRESEIVAASCVSMGDCRLNP